MLLLYFISRYDGKHTPGMIGESISPDRREYKGPCFESRSFLGDWVVALQSCEVPHRYSRFPFPASQIALALWSIKVLREYYSIFFAALFIGLRKRFSPDLAPHATIGVIIPTSFYYWGDNPYLASSSNQSKPVVIIQISRF